MLPVDARVLSRSGVSPPPGQGPYALSLISETLVVKARKVLNWNVIDDGSRGSEAVCNAGTTSLSSYTCVWSSSPPQSPVLSGLGPEQDLILVPYGATDLRIGEFPTTVTQLTEGDGLLVRNQ